ncbi:MAG: tellurite resistance protein [Parvularcula sp.]|nr:tellurite resistance protein [Parvularcula sp.]
MTAPVLPSGVEKYAETPVFSETSVPEKLLGLHDTKPGVWGRIVILEGQLDYIIPGPPEQHYRLSTEQNGIIRPTELHRVVPVGAVRFKVEFFKENNAP